MNLPLNLKTESWEIPVWYSGLRIQCYRSCSAGQRGGEGSIPGPGTPTCRRHGKKKIKKYSFLNLFPNQPVHIIDERTRLIERARAALRPDSHCSFSTNHFTPELWLPFFLPSWRHPLNSSNTHLLRAHHGLGICARNGDSMKFMTGM